MKSSIKNKIVAFLKLYAIFAVMNSGYKIFHVVFVHLRAKWLWRKLPGSLNDFLGAKISKNINRLYDYQTEEILRYPRADFVKICAGSPKPKLFCVSPRAVKFILCDKFNQITKPDQRDDTAFRLLKYWLGKDSLPTLTHGAAYPVEHKKWSKQRRIVGKFLPKMSKIVPGGFIHERIWEKTKNLMDFVLDKSESGEYFDMQKVFSRFSMDCVEEVFFGRDSNSFKDFDDPNRQETYADQFDAAHDSSIRMIFELLLPSDFAYFLPWPFDHIAQEALLRSCKETATFEANVKKVHEHINGYINELENRNVQDEKEKEDFVSIFLRENNKNIPLLQTILQTATIGGRDTAAATLSWCIFCLSTRPDLENMLYTEIQNLIFSKDLEPEALSAIELDSLPLLNGFVLEVLRLYPQVPDNRLRVSQDVVFIDGTRIPKGTVVHFHPYLMGRNPLVYNNPQVIDPKRWIDKDGNLIPFDETAFPVFKAGRRNCLGRDLAIFEIKVALISLINKVKFSLKHGEEEKIWYTLGFNLQITNHPNRKTKNLWIRVTKR
eukprot:snap_masked-scaffold_35-processed-gene-0.16-mRNA-1 protein AED:0.86 eAED:0.86 QI:0/-1/0/1/-1/1/1/0/548